MDLKILPNELFVTEHGALIRTRCPKENITDAMIHQRVVAGNLAAGDVVKIQCMNHERDAVLHFREYLVFSRISEFKRVEVSDQVDRQGEHVRFSTMPITDWKDTPEVKAIADAKAAALAAVEAEAKKDKKAKAA